MNIPINHQKEKIKKYFNLMVKEFITDPRHNKDISIIFKQSFDNPLKLGETEQSGGGSKTLENTTWTTINGVKVPGSEKTTTTTTYEPYKYVISFLNNYKNEDELRGTVVHEFTHLYLYATIGGKHYHDDRFYSTMERLENWLNQSQGLSPRVDKSHDRDQYVGDNNSDTNDKENTCPECSYLSPHHSPQCSHKQSKNNPDPQKAIFNLLKNTLKNSKDLATLEKNYQTVKGNSLYSSSNGDKSRLDNLYQAQKWYLQSHSNDQSTNNSNSSLKENNSGADSIFWLCLAGGGIVLVGIIVYLVGRKSNYNPNRKKKIR